MGIYEVKICARCYKELDLSFFYKQKNGLYGVGSKCKQCEILRRIEYRNRSEDNKKRERETSKKYHNRNPDKVKKTKENILKRDSAYFAKAAAKNRNKDREAFKKYARDYIKNRKKVDISFKIKTNIRSRLSSIIKNKPKACSPIVFLGCSIEELKTYLESKFQLYMTWDNYGEWHIDHIKPLSKFDLTNPEQFKQACHYTNLQPLWAKDNLVKSNKWEEK